MSPRTFTQDDPLWNPLDNAPEEEPRHILTEPVPPGEMATALCGYRWKVQRLHGMGIGAATCPDCLAAAWRV